MTSQILGPNSTIVLGLSLAKDETPLLTSVVSLVKKTGARVILTHCMRPFYSFAYAGEGTVYPIDTYENILNEMDSKAATEKLEGIQAQTFSGLESKVHVTRDYAADGLIATAAEFSASLIVVGADLTESSILTGMSTSITLMKHSKIPSLVIPDKQTILFERPFPAIVADGLDENYNDFLLKTHGFLKSIDSDKIIQVHVKEVHEKELERLVENVKTAMILGKIPDDENFSISSLQEKIRVRKI